MPAGRRASRARSMRFSHGIRNTAHLPSTTRFPMIGARTRIRRAAGSPSGSRRRRAHGRLNLAIDAEARMKRRTFLANTAGSVLAAYGLGAPLIARAQAVDRSKLSKTLRFSSYGGNWQEGLTTAAIKPFEEKYGVQVLQESHGSEAQLIAKMKASGAGAYDVVTVNESGLYLGVKQG